MTVSIFCTKTGHSADLGQLLRKLLRFLLIALIGPAVSLNLGAQKPEPEPASKTVGGEEQPASEEADPSSLMGATESSKFQPNLSQAEPENSESSESKKKPTSPASTSRSVAKVNEPLPETDPLVRPLVFVSISLAFFTGGLVVYIIILRARGRSFDVLREEVLSGSGQVPLLTEEALELIRQFRAELSDSATRFHNKADEHQSRVEDFVNRAEEIANDSHAKTHETVSTFKGSMNNMLENLQKFMGKVVEDAKRTRDEAAETKELTKQVAKVVREKEEQFQNLQEGYQKSLLGPITKEFLNLRDELLSLREQTEGEVADQLDAIDKKLVQAFAETGIQEIPIAAKPDDLPPGYWETVGAAIPTDDYEKHGTVERVHTRGYTVCRPDGEIAVLRKAVVVRYAHSLDASKSVSGSNS